MKKKHEFRELFLFPILEKIRPNIEYNESRLKDTPVKEYASENGP